MDTSIHQYEHKKWQQASEMDKWAKHEQWDLNDRWDIGWLQLRGKDGRLDVIIISPIFGFFLFGRNSGTGERTGVPRMQWMLCAVKGVTTPETYIRRSRKRMEVYKKSRFDFENVICILLTVNPYRINVPIPLDRLYYLPIISWKWWNELELTTRHQQPTTILDFGNSLISAT